MARADSALRAAAGRSLSWRRRIEPSASSGASSVLQVPDRASPLPLVRDAGQERCVARELGRVLDRQPGGAGAPPGDDQRRDLDDLAVTTSTRPRLALGGLQVILGRCGVPVASGHQGQQRM
jgi:hypothetical protein